MQWATLSEGETGESYAYLPCTVCGAPFIESELDDLIFFPDTRSMRTQDEVAFLKQHHDIDLTAEPVLVCRACTERIDGKLRQSRR